MPLLRRVEDVFVQLVRIVLLAFSLVVLLAMASYLWDKTWGKSQGEAPANVAWQSLAPDLQFVVEETGRDMGLQSSERAFTDSVTRPQLRTAFQQADAVVRQFIAQKPEHHARIEKDNESLGLAELHPLLQGDTVPTQAQIDAYEQSKQAKENARHAPPQDAEAALDSDAAHAAAMATDAAAEAVAATAACCTDDDTTYWTDPVDVALAVHERATQVQSEYDAQAYVAYVTGAPKALERVLNDSTLAPKLHDLPVSRLVDMVLTNYSISFSRAITGEETSQSLWDSFFDSLELTMWSLIMSFLVMVVFVVMVIRMEKHLRLLSQQGLRNLPPQ